MSVLVLSVVITYWQLMALGVNGHLTCHELRIMHRTCTHLLLWKISYVSINVSSCLSKFDLPQSVQNEGWVRRTQGDCVVSLLSPVRQLRGC